MYHNVSGEKVIKLGQENGCKMSFEDPKVKARPHSYKQANAIFIHIILKVSISMHLLLQMNIHIAELWGTVSLAKIPNEIY